jgi:hypothetical protein
MRCLLSEDGIDKSIKIKLSRWGLGYFFISFPSFFFGYKLYYSNCHFHHCQYFEIQTNLLYY